MDIDTRARKLFEEHIDTQVRAVYANPAFSAPERVEQQLRERPWETLSEESRNIWRQKAGIEMDTE